MTRRCCWQQLLLLLILPREDSADTGFSRSQYGAYHHFVAELLEDGDDFHRYFRMAREQFAHIHFLVEPLLKKQATTRAVLCLR